MLTMSNHLLRVSRADDHRRQAPGRCRLGDRRGEDRAGPVIPCGGSTQLPPRQRPPGADSPPGAPAGPAGGRERGGTPSAPSIERAGPGDRHHLTARSTPRQASRPSTMARMRRRSSSVSEPQASISRARSAGTASDFARATPPPSVSTGKEVTGSNPVPPTFGLFSISRSPGKTVFSSGIVSFPLPTCDGMQSPAIGCIVGFCSSVTSDFARLFPPP